MPAFVEMDERTALSTQMEETVGPVILINQFTVEPNEADQLLNAWAVDAAWMKRQPGFILTQLHRGIGAAAYSSTTRSGNRPRTSSARSRTQNSNRSSGSTPQARWCHPISSARWRCRASVWGSQGLVANPCAPAHHLAGGHGTGLGQRAAQPRLDVGFAKGLRSETRWRDL
jgi:hypothetical protein